MRELPLDRAIYCGPIDAFYDYKLGILEYRSLRFESEVLDEGPGPL